MLRRSDNFLNRPVVMRASRAGKVAPGRFIAQRS
jgi:hypothetical protein